MSDVVNPYQSPEAPAIPVTPLTAQGALTETMLSYLKGASPWIRFIGVLGFISSGLAALWGICMLVLVPFMNLDWEEIPGLEQFGFIFNAAFGGVMMVFSLGGAVLIFIPSLFIYRFGEKIRSFLRTGMEQELELAFKNNKSLWKFIGIYCIIVLASIPVMIIGGIIIAVVVALA